MRKKANRFVTVALLTTGTAVFALRGGAEEQDRAERQALARKIEGLIQKLEHDRFGVREEATKELIAIGRPAIPLLRKALESPDLEVRSRARRVLDAVQTGVEYLLDELKSKEPERRAAALRALVEHGEKAKVAVPTLVAMLKDPDAGVREAALSAILSIDPENKAAAGLVPAKAHVNGKYAKLLRRVHAPQDQQTYGEYREYGPYQATDYYDEKNIPAGHWVYVYPHWYIWGEVRGQGALAPPAPPVRR